jgi:cholest-4-en-3-one 26-monooxygenase
VIAELMGAPDADRSLLLDWTRRTFDIEAADSPGDPKDAEAAMMELFEYSCQMAKEKRKHPKDDLASVLLSVEIDGEQLTEVQFAMFFKLLTQAGNETTRSLISSTIWLLTEHPDQQARLRIEPSLLPSTVEEALRFYTPVLHFARVATCDLELRGQRIREGDIVVMWYVSANRDEEVFEEPDRFDIGRSPNHHVSFGAGGPHFCLGAGLARIEALALLGELLRRIKTIEPVGPMERLKSCFINQIKQMPVRFTPA